MNPMQKPVAARSLFASAVAICLAAGGLMAGAASSSAQELYGTLKKINDTNTITIAARDSSIPFSYYDDKKQSIGFAMDLCARIVDEVKKALKKPELQVKYITVNAQTRIALMANHTTDIECGSTTNTLSRQQQVDFSSVYFTTGTRLLTRKAANAKEIEDFQGKTIAVPSASTNERAVKALIDAGKLKNVRILNVKDHAEGLIALETDRVDAYASDDIVLYGLKSKSKIKSDLDIVGRFLSYDPYGLMLSRDDSAFRLLVNKTLADIFRSGEIEKLYSKWLEPLGVPMTPLIKAAYELQAFPE
jgi:glutamate/aspartate transport system substrate-binding protein